MLEVGRIFQEAGTSTPPPWRWRIEGMSQIGLLLYDFDIFRTSYECLLWALDMAKKHHKRALALSPYPEEEEQFIANQYRRLCLAMTTQDMVPQNFEQEVLDALHSGLNVFLRHRNYRSYATSLDILSHRERELTGADSKLLFEVIQQALLYEEKIENKWVEASHHLNLGLFHDSQYLISKSKRSKDEAVKHLRIASRIFSEKSICPETTIRGETGTLERVLKSLGCTDAPVITRRGEFPLSLAELRDVLNSVSGYTV